MNKKGTIELTYDELLEFTSNVSATAEDRLMEVIFEREITKKRWHELTNELWNEKKGVK